MYLALDSVNNISQVLSLLVIFAFVLAITYFTTKYIANYQKGKMSESNIKMLEGARITQKQFIQIVKIGEKYFALAVSKDNVNVICEIPENELKFDQDESVKMSFSDIFAKYTKKKTQDTISDNSGDENIDSSSEVSEESIDNQDCLEDDDMAEQDVLEERGSAE